MTPMASRRPCAMKLGSTAWLVRKVCSVACAPTVPASGPPSSRAGTSPSSSSALYSPGTPSAGHRCCARPPRTARRRAPSAIRWPLANSPSGPPPMSDQLQSGGGPARPTQGRPHPLQPHHPPSSPPASGLSRRVRPQLTPPVHAPMSPPRSAGNRFSLTAVNAAVSAGNLVLGGPFFEAGRRFLASDTRW